MKFKGQKHKTDVHYDGGKNPRWNKQFNLYVADINDPISFAVLDSETINDDDVGDTKLTIKEIIGNNLTG